MHPLLDAAERMLDDFATTVANLRPLLQALGHAIEHGLVFEAGNGAHVVRASRAYRAVSTSSSIPVIDFGEIAQPAVADRRQQLAGWADVGVAARVVAKLVLAEEALADRGAALWSGNVRNAAGPLTGLDVLDFEVAAIGDDVIVATSRISRAGSAVCVNRPMSTMAWSPPARRSACPSRRRRPGCCSRRRPWCGRRWRGCPDRSARSGPRRFARAGDEHRLVAAALLLERCDLLCQVGPRPAACRPVRDIVLVEPLQVVLQPLVGRTDERAQRAAGEVAVLVVDRLDAGPVDRQQLSCEGHCLAQQYELAEHRSEGAAIVAAEVAIVLKSG